MIIAKIEKMKAYTGIANAEPDSRMPAQVQPRETSTMMPTENHTGWSPTTGIAEPMLATPAAVETATVRM